MVLNEITLGEVFTLRSLIKSALQIWKEFWEFLIDDLTIDILNGSRVMINWVILQVL
jgi:hypothetical protein